MLTSKVSLTITKCNDSTVVFVAADIRGLHGNPTVAEDFFVIAISQPFQKKRHTKTSAHPVNPIQELCWNM
jgi:hypothetical protein